MMTAPAQVQHAGRMLTHKGGRMGMRKQDPESSEYIAPLLTISICIEKADFFLIVANTGHIF